MNSCRAAKFLRRAVGFAMLFVVWDGFVRIDAYKLFARTVPDSFFPTVPTILASAWESITEPSYHHALFVTLSRVLIAFLVSSAIGISVGLVASRSRWVEDLLWPVTELCRNLPAAAVVPLAVFAFGLGSSMKIFVAMFGAVFSIYAATVDGIKAIHPLRRLAALAYGWRGWRLMFGVVLPSAATTVLAGQRIALAISFIVIILAEMLVGSDGLGGRLVLHERGFDFPPLYAEVLLLGVLGILLSVLFGVFAKTAVFWQRVQSWGA